MGKTLRISSSSDGDSYSSKPPKGAKITKNNVSTTTEEIENGWLVTKSYDGRYTVPGEKASSNGCSDCGSDGHYFSYTKKWFSKTDPLTVTVNDDELADVFPDEDD